MIARIAPNYIILTAQEACNLAPHKWAMPPKDAIALLKPGHMVKLVVDAPEVHKAEAIWVAILTRKRAKFVGTVWTDPPPRRTHYHGIIPGDIINFEVKHVLDIAFEVKTEKQPKGVRII